MNANKKTLGTGLAIVLAVAMLFSLSAINLPSAQGAPSPESEINTTANEKINMLIGFHETPNRRLVERHGGVIYREFSIVNVIAARVTPRAAEDLAQNPAVRYVELDGPVYALEPILVPLADNTTVETTPWGINRVFGNEEFPFETWGISTGLDIGVAVLDSGVKAHYELEIVGGHSVFDDEEGYDDIYGHGTHVAGTVAALNNDLTVLDEDNKGVVGVSPEVKLYAVKVLDDDGIGSASTVVAGIEWAVEQGIPVMNMSLGGGSNQTLQDACDTAYENGHLLVAAAGNSGDHHARGRNISNVTYPASYESVIAVAASDVDDNWASFSSTGPEVELIAPGVSVLSTWKDDVSRFDPQPFCVKVDNECYYYKYGRGTSMSSPHVAGTAALAWAVNPGLTNVEIRTILQDTAEDLRLDPNHQGHGLVRADLAVKAAEDLEPLSTGNIEGTVTEDDEDSAAIEGATVVVEGTDLSATTNFDGDYLLENVPIGDQNVTASADGYNSQTLTVTVSENETVTQNFTLEETEDASGLTINHFVLTNTSNPAWARVTVEWTVSSDIGLASVKTDMILEGEVVDTETSTVSGGTASGTHELRVRGGHGETYKVELTVIDTEGNPISQTKEIEL